MAVYRSIARAPVSASRRRSPVAAASIAGSARQENDRRRWIRLGEGETVGNGTRFFGHRQARFATRASAAFAPPPRSIRWCGQERSRRRSSQSTGSFAKIRVWYDGDEVQRGAPVVEFNELGFHFQYPDNWSATREASPTFPRSVQVHSPSGAFWSVTADRIPPHELISQVAAAISSEYEDVERHVLKRTIGDRSLEGFELNFYCLDFIVVVQILGWTHGGASWAIVTQAEMRDHDQLQDVFDAMTWSLIGDPRRGGRRST
jgi:hypothetical protein